VPGPEAVGGVMNAVLAIRAELTQDDVLTVVVGLVAGVLSLPPGEVTPEARLLEDLGAESIDLLDLRFRIEDALGLKVSAEGFIEVCGRGLSPSEFRSAFTVSALATYLAARLGARR
jgi:acyl carrier protein